MQRLLLLYWLAGVATGLAIALLLIDDDGGGRGPEWPWPREPVPPFALEDVRTH